MNNDATVKDPGTEEDVASQLMSNMEKFMEMKAEEMGLNKPVRASFKAEPGDEDAPEEGEEAAEEKGLQRAASFFKAMANNDKAKIKSLSEGTGSEGGYLVPVEFRAELLRVVETVGLVRRLARVIPMRSDTMTIPSLTTQPTVSWPGECNPGTESDPVFGQVTLDTETAIGLTVVCNELLQDATPDIVNVLAELMGEQLAAAEDLQGLAGSGAPFTGILNDAGVNTVIMSTGNTAFEDIDVTDLADLVDAVSESSAAGAGFVMHRNILNYLRKLQDGAGNYIFNPTAPTPQGGVGTIWGYPVFTSDQMPGAAASAISTNFVIFGNMRNLLLGDRQRVEMALSDSAVIAGASTFERFQTAVRFTERIAIAVGVPAAFSVLQTAAS